MKKLLLAALCAVGISVPGISQVPNVTVPDLRGIFASSQPVDPIILIDSATGKHYAVSMVSNRFVISRAASARKARSSALFQDALGVRHTLSISDRRLFIK